MRQFRWWKPDAPHWANRTMAVVAILALVVTTTLGLLAFRPGTGVSTPAAEPGTSGGAAPEVQSMCSASSDGLVSAGWGPDRPVYHDDTHPTALTFNSTASNPNYGDERNWVIARSAESVDPGDWTDDVEVQDGETYLVRSYLRLDGPSGHSAINTRMSVVLPSCSGRRVGLAAVLSAEQVYPSKIWDGVRFWSPKSFNLVLESGSALLVSHSDPSGLPLPESDLVSREGALIGSQQLDGRVHPGYKDSVIVTFRVRAEVRPD